LSSVYVPGLGNVRLPVSPIKPCSARQWNEGVLAVDWPPLPPVTSFLFFETPAGIASDGLGGVFLLATGRQDWLSHTGGSYTLRYIGPAGAVSSPRDFQQPRVDIGVLGPNPQAAVVPAAPGSCIALWGWHQGQRGIVFQRFDQSLHPSGWGPHPKRLSAELYSGQTPNNLAAEPDGNGGALAAWWSAEPAGAWSARAGWVKKSGALGWSGPVTVAAASQPANPGSWLQIVPGASAGEAIVVVPEIAMAGTTFRAYAIDENGTVSPPTTLAGPVPDDAVSFLRTRAAVTDGKGGLFLGYVDASASLHVLRCQPPSAVSWDLSLGPVVNTRAFQLREDGAGGVLAAWVRAGSGASGPRVELQRLGATGTIKWDINATSGFLPLELLIPPGSSAWLPDDWARLVQAVPTRTGGALLVFTDFPGAARIAKLFSVCFDSSGVQLQGSVQEVSRRTGPQELPLLVATSTDGGVTAWSDESSSIAGAQVWANKIGCCDFFTGLPFPIPIPCELNSPEGGGFGGLPWWLPCGDRDGQYGFMTLMRLARLGVNLPGCVVNRASPAPAWMRL